MKTASCKAKGRRLQQIVRDAILAAFPQLRPDDVRSTGMGQGGCDVQLSPVAQNVFHFRVECKNRRGYAAVYAALDQAASHPGPATPIAVLKQNHHDPVVVIGLADFMKLASTRAAFQSIL